MRCFLVCLLFGCFLSLSWVLLGTLLRSLARFGSSVGSLLGFPSGVLGSFLELLKLSWAALGRLLAYLESLLEALGLLLGFPL